MTLDPEVARSAQYWTEKMVNGMGMVHANSDENGGCGENLAMSSDMDAMEHNGEATRMWYDESINPGYDYNNPGFSHGTGHFTQVVWKGSTVLGCGYYQGWVTCRYCNEAGNMMGSFPENVSPPL